jgi:3-isopropylmalate/(R)-2-methylmalate dehydratase small subunit
MTHPYKFTSRLAPLLVNDIDTDQIIPARFLKATDKLGMGEHLFADWRYQADGGPNPTFPLNREVYRGAEILLAGDNFGCGSSREHAAWALKAYGFRAIISTSFADIFKNNALKNGLLPIQVSADVHASLRKGVEQNPRFEVHVDLDEQEITFGDGLSEVFPVDPFSKYCLIHRVDELGYLLKFLKQIEHFEATH